MLPHKILFCSCVYSIPYPYAARKGVLFDFSQTFSNRQLLQNRYHGKKAPALPQI